MKLSLACCFLFFDFAAATANSFAQDDLKGVAQRLEAMVKSMDVLKDMPEAEDRAATLRELQERLEALLKPKLLEVSDLFPSPPPSLPLSIYISLSRSLSLSWYSLLRERCVVGGPMSTRFCSKELEVRFCVFFSLFSGVGGVIAVLLVGSIDTSRL